MPNHTKSLLEFRGLSSDIKKLLESIKGLDAYNQQKLFTFHRIIPMPSNIKRGPLRAMSFQGNDNWYNWSVDNWDTKWDAYDVSILTNVPPQSVNFINPKSKSIAQIRFQTAWSPVPKVVARLSEMFPNVLIKYSYLDEGGSFCGVEYFKKGSCYKHTLNNFKTIQRVLRYVPKSLDGVTSIK